MDHAINAPGHENIFVFELNATGKHFLKGKMELIGKLASNNTSKIGMVSSASKEISIKVSDQCIHIINNKERFNGLKGSKKFKRENHYSILITYRPHGGVRCRRVPN